MADAKITRRDVVAGLVALGAAGAVGAVGRRLWTSREATREAEVAGTGLLVRGRDPDQLETPRALLDRLVTPNEEFFVRTHAHPPRIDPRRFSLAIGGLVGQPKSWAIEALGQRPRVERLAVLQCAGNGRAFFRPRIPGVAWEHGGCGQARWGGVPLAELLAEVQPQAEGKFLHLHGLDTQALPATPVYVRSLPIERALADDVLLATTMNGAPLPWLHGGPLRLVVPGWTGNHWVKWLAKIEVATEEEPSFYSKTGYRMPITPVAPGEPPGPTAPVTENTVKAIVASPGPGAQVRAGSIAVRGVAFSGRTHVSRVEVGTRVGDGPANWQEATLEGDETPGAWRVFSAQVTANPGPLVVMARATDARGEPQPTTALWNPSGYLWNAIEEVPVEVIA
jgi:DMSO/TMAO reductase YedYZ molybdopterin-dependent catalytic subunit